MPLGCAQPVSRFVQNCQSTCIESENVFPHEDLLRTLWIPGKENGPVKRRDVPPARLIAGHPIPIQPIVAVDVYLEAPSLAKTSGPADQPEEVPRRTIAEEGKRMSNREITPPAPSDSLADFARENGFFLLFQKVIGAAIRRSRDRLLANRLRTRGLRIGKHPKLEGLAHMHIGENFSAGNGLWLHAVTSFAGHRYEPSLSIGPNCNVSDQVHIACTLSITIAEGMLCGSRVIISDHAHGIYSGPRQSPPTQRPVERPLSSQRTVTIGRNVWIGDGCAIIAGAHIGDGSIIGANSVVTGPIPPNTIATGIPARPLRQWDETTGQWLRIER